MRRNVAVRGWGAFTAALVVVLATSPAATAQTFGFDRYAGETRYETSAWTTNEFYRLRGENRNPALADIADKLSHPRAAVLVSGEDEHVWDALAANYLAREHGAPIVLTPGSDPQLPARTLWELEAFAEVYVVGGTAAVSASQEAQLKAAGFAVTRIAGEDRFATVERVLEHVGQSPSDTALIATGWDFPDALGAGPVSYAGGMPVALANQDGIDAGLVQELQDAGISKAVVIGGEAAVPQQVIEQLEAAGIDVTERLAGRTRAATSVAVAEWAVARGILGIDLVGGSLGVNFASGREYSNGADALTGGPLSAVEGRPLLITENADVAGDSLVGYLARHRESIGQGHIFGGRLAVSPAVQAQLEWVMNQ